MKIKTIDITAKEWFDKTNGNSYFSARVILNYGMKNKQLYYLPFQYGYGDHYIDMAKKVLQTAFKLFIPETDALWHYCQDHKIILRTSKIENCLKREVVGFGQE